MRELAGDELDVIQVGHKRENLGEERKRGDVLKAMRVPPREFESRALSEIRALPGPGCTPSRAVLKLRDGE